MGICHTCGKENQAQARFCNWCGTTMSRTSSTGSLPAHMLLNDERYAIVKLIGQGGMGAVYKALDLHVRQRVVAIKEMSQSGLSSQELQEAIDSFTHEAEILARLNHHSLPKIYQQFEENGRCYLVMEFIDGETLEQRWSRYRQQGKRMPIGQILAICVQLCTVLEYLHTQQPAIIFRDLKPANIMVTPQEQVYLIDFGIARLFKPGQVKDTVALGSPGYAPPEQYRNATSPRSDIYSFGATLHQLLTGDDPSQTPFHFKQFSIRMPVLEELVMSMVATDEVNRPANMKSVQKILHSIAQEPRQNSVAHTSKPVTSTISDARPVTIFAVVSAAEQDERLWRSLHGQLKLLIDTFPNVQIHQLSHDPNASQDVVEQANLILFLLSEDFLASSVCIAAAYRAIERAEKGGVKVLSVVLRPCAWQGTRLSQVSMVSSDAIAHLSLYAQEQRILEVTRSVRMLLATLMLAGRHLGAMSLSQWLLWQFYGNGGINCPYFVVGQYALKYIRLSGRAGVLFHLFDLRTGQAVADYVIGSQNGASLSSLIGTIAPAYTSAADVQGVAMRARPPELATR